MKEGFGDGEGQRYDAGRHKHTDERLENRLDKERMKTIKLDARRW